MAHGDEKPPVSDSRGQESTWAWGHRPPPADAASPSDSQTAVTGLSPAGRSGPRFTAGALLAGRFRILRFLAKGGMGEVYEAQDLELDERVAVKAIRPDLADDDHARERFRREIQLSRRVTHPNVCRIFDLFHHESAGERVVFLTMELLAGETLAERLKRDGPVSTAQALPWVRQLAAGLAAAHRAGVVHRDFNPKNVLLVPGEPGTRAVITDFGLAHAARELEGAAALTASGVMVGTPAYMSPEQVEGKPATAASDVYALGCVLFEMVTGRWPFVGDSALSTAVLRLKGAAPSPRGLQPGLDARWEAAILRCLERKPADRFAAIEDLLGALEAPRVKAHTQRLRRRSVALLKAWPSWLAGGALLLAGGIWAVRSPFGRSPAPAAAPAPAARPLRVAVLPFTNLAASERWAWLSTGLAEMLSTELAAGEGLTTVSASSVALAQRELELDRDLKLGRAPSNDDLRRLARNLGADRVLRGSFGVLESPERTQLRLDLHLVEPSSGSTLLAFPVEGGEAEIFALVERVGEQLRRRIGAAAPPAQERVDLESLQPHDADARRLYNEALARLRAFDPAGARDRLLEAVAREPEFALAHLELANAWSLLGYERSAAEAAALARAGAAALPPRARLLVEARYLELHRQRDKAIELYRSLWQFAPADLESGLRLVAAETEAALGGRALSTLGELRQAVGGDDPRLDLAQADAAFGVGDYAQAKQAAARAERGAEERGARLLLARARLGAALAEQSLGNVQPARAGFEGALELFSALGDRAGEAKALHQLARLEDRHGNSSRALALYTSTRELGRRLGDERLTARVEVDLAGLERREGRIAAARARYEAALVELRRLGAQQDEADALMRLANMMLSQDDLEGARRTYEDALALRRLGEKRDGPFGVLMNLGNLYLHMGDLAAGRASYAEALELARGVGARGYAAYALAGQGQVAFLAADLATARERFAEAALLAQETEDAVLVSWISNAWGETLLLAGDLPAARRELEHALAKRAGRVADVAETERTLAQLFLAEGRAGEAAGRARAAEAALLGAGQPSAAAIATGWLALAEAEMDRPAEARAAAERALAAVRGGLRRGDRLRVALAAGRSLARAGEPARARDLLAAAASEAENLGYLAIALESRIALAGVEAALQPSAPGPRSNLTALAGECEKKGLGLLTTRARGRGY